MNKKGLPPVTYRLWEDEDEEQILRLMRCGYGDMEIAYHDYFDWEYRRNPAGRATIGVGHLPDGVVVTALATVPTPIIFKGRSLVGSQLVNGVTDPEYRGCNLFPSCANMVWQALEGAGVALSYGFPNPRSFPGLTKKVGYINMGRACLLMRPHAPAELLARRLPSGRRLGLGGFDRLLVRGLSKQLHEKTVVSKRPSFDGLFMEHLHETAALGLRRDIDWLNWRYVKIPRRTYSIIAVGNASRPEGVAVYRICDWDKLRIGTINDLFLAPDCGPDMLESLVCHILRECEESECAVTFCLVAPESRKLRMLRHLGFWVVPARFEPQPFRLIIRGHTVSVSDFSVSDMDVSFGAYDVF